VSSKTQMAVAMTLVPAALAWLIIIGMILLIVWLA
jgi:hypothetical protein